MPTNIYMYTNYFAIRRLGQTLLSLTDSNRRNRHIICQPWRKLTEFILLYHQHMHTHHTRGWKIIFISMHNTIEQSRGVEIDPPGLEGPLYLRGWINELWVKPPTPSPTTQTLHVPMTWLSSMQLSEWRHHERTQTTEVSNSSLIKFIIHFHSIQLPLIETVPNYQLPSKSKRKT
jgi:hypothetical protein